jgi:hypothetical protein
MTSTMTISPDRGVVDDLREQPAAARRGGKRQDAVAAGWPARRQGSGVLRAILAWPDCPSLRNCSNARITHGQQLQMMLR